MSTLPLGSGWMLEQAQKLLGRYRHVRNLVDPGTQEGIRCTVGKPHERKQSGGAVALYTNVNCTGYSKCPPGLTL